MYQDQKYILTAMVIFLLFMGSSCNSQTHQPTTHGDHAYTNELINSSSPYLLQHAHNPVDWYPWGQEALEKAQKENKLLIISVGYSACHWCHVMERESFEDTAVAKLMNDNFVSIKVDREERPDVDQIYMNAAYMTTGRGGWPLNAIALPDGKPVFAATYFPKEDWLRVLNQFVKLQKENPDKLTEVAGQITEGIQQMNFSELNPQASNFTPELLGEISEGILSTMDFSQGGLNKAPKFPMPNVHQLLLRYHHLSKDEKALEAVTITLDRMADGGIYDHVGGGFARYSTDRFWKVPHFEKMLYDNGQLMSLYSEAYQLTRKARYKEVVYESLEFIEREMTSPEGGFYSSLDADSEGEEGKFYVWSEEEIKAVLGEDAETFNEYFSVKTSGNWEGENILHITKSLTDIAEKQKISEEELAELVIRSKPKLLKKRSERIRPGLDDKVLTSWNALMLKGYVDSYRVFGEERFLKTALRNAQFLKTNMLRKDGGLNRIYKDGKSSVNGFLDDYSFMIEAYVALYQATFDESWLFEADKLMKYTLTHFFEEKSGMFFYTSDEDDPLITRSKEVADNVIPGSNSSLAKGLFLLGTYLYKDDYLKKSEQMLNNVSQNLAEQGPYHSNWGILMTYFSNLPYEIAIVGPDHEKFRKEFDQQFLPHAFFLGGESEGKLELLENKLVKGATYIYVCQNKSCKLPVQSVPEALELMK